MARAIDSRSGSLLIHAGAILCCAGIYWLSDRPENTLLYGGLIVFASYAWIAVREGKDSPLLLSPASIFFAWFSIGYGLATFWAGKRVGDGELIQFSTVFLDPRTLGPGFLLCLVGAFSLHVGMHLTRPGRSVEDKPAFGPLGTRAALALLAVWGLAFIIRVFNEESKLLGGLTGLFGWGGLSSLATYALTQGRRPIRPRLFWPTLLVGSALEMILYLHGGSKAYLMFSFVPLIWLFFADSRLRLGLVPLAVIFGIVYFRLVWPVLTQARITPRKDGEGNAALIMRVFLDEWQGDVDLNEGKEQFFSRQFETAPMAFIYGEAERYGFHYGSSMGYIWAGFVPRALWPDKPAQSRGRWFDTYLAHNTLEADPGNSLGQSATGELYWNFGWFGAMLGMLILGLLVGVLWRVATPMPLWDPIRMLLYTQLSLLITNFAEAGSTLLGFVQMWLVFGLILWLIANWRRRTGTSGKERRRRAPFFSSGPEPLLKQERRGAAGQSGTL